MRALFATLMLCLATDAGAEDILATDSDVAKWYESLRQPDLPGTSCCGEADAYWADSFEVDGDRYVAIITDERPDTFQGADGVVRSRPHIAPGTRIIVPNNKLKFDAGNPTGHGVIFLSGPESLIVFCYIVPGGV